MMSGPLYAPLVYLPAKRFHLIQSPLFLIRMDWLLFLHYPAALFVLLYFPYWNLIIVYQLIILSKKKVTQGTPSATKYIPIAIGIVFLVILCDLCAPDFNSN